MVDDELALLNVFDIEVEGMRRHLLCFLDVVRAGARGIPSHAIVGECGAVSEEVPLDPRSLRINPEFIAALTQYMNDRVMAEPSLMSQARESPSGWVYILDARNPSAATGPMPPEDIVGAFAVDGAGQVVPGSFQYNSNHLLFHPERGTSALFADRNFYDWMHPLTGTVRL